MYTVPWPLYNPSTISTVRWVPFHRSTLTNLTFPWPITAALYSTYILPFDSHHPVIGAHHPLLNTRVLPPATPYCLAPRLHRHSRRISALLHLPQCVHRAVQYVLDAASVL